jgi:hypothetical protein
VTWLLDLFRIEGKGLDLGGGYGLFTRLMRDAGFDYYTTDLYCKNLFAIGFEPSPGFQASVLTAFEVMEHIRDPYRFVSEAFAAYGCRTLIFSTLCYGAKIPDRDWWYWSFLGGQHITFYSENSLALLAKKLGCEFHRIREELYVITDRPLGQIERLAILHPKIKKWREKWKKLRGRKRRTSLTWADHLAARERLITARAQLASERT